MRYLFDTTMHPRLVEPHPVEALADPQAVLMHGPHPCIRTRMNPARFDGQPLRGGGLRFLLSFLPCGAMWRRGTRMIRGERVAMQPPPSPRSCETAPSRAMASPEVLRDFMDGPAPGWVSRVALGRAPQTAQSRREEGRSMFEHRACVGLDVQRETVAWPGREEPEHRAVPPNHSKPLNGFTGDGRRGALHTRPSGGRDPQGEHRSRGDGPHYTR